MKILLPTDGSDFSIASARACAEIAAKEEAAEIRVISVIESLTPDEPFDTESDYFQAVRQASKAAAEENVEIARRIILDRPGNENLKVETKTLTGKPDKMIIREAEEWEADLVVIASHGYGFWARTLLGSVSDSVVHHAPCSVLVVRTGKAAV
jgi:nucleotide-binding universal stress UspA family protein